MIFSDALTLKLFSKIFTENKKKRKKNTFKKPV